MKKNIRIKGFIFSVDLDLKVKCKKWKGNWILIEISLW